MQGGNNGNAREDEGKMMELNPCPICGGEAEHIKLFASKRYDCFFRCKKCGYETKAYTSKQNAEKAWNREREMGKTLYGKAPRV